MKKIAIIGAGNIGGAIARGLIKGTLIPAKNITLSDVSEKTLEKLRQTSSEWQLTTSNKEAIKDADVIIISVKPWLVDVVADEIRKHVVYDNQIIVSIAAGVTFAHLKDLFNEHATIFRVIPNTAIEIKESVSSIAYLNAGDEQVNLIKAIFDELGKTFIVKEEQLSAFTSLSSSGIAYAFRYIRAAMEGGVEMGIHPEIAQEVVLQTLLGAARLLEENKSHPEAEIDKVTTPGGITIKGLNEMEANGFTTSVIKGLLKSKI
ncbi:Pyrroline-5-carboxylate reductase [uncultured Paludibacter sp.]|nr:Pyrroline-5-carboxylate reductase [uncultured Paludibacter sp.]